MNDESLESGKDIAANLVPAALAMGTASHEKADRFLDDQTILTRLQARELALELRLRHWTLRVNHLSGVMKLAFECAAAFIIVAAAACLGAAIWTAAHDKSLVIEALDVPPDLVERGLSGQVIAARIEDRLSWMQAHTVTSRPGSTYRHDWGDDIKVQIPQTGISVGELYRYLSGWLGSQTHITGEIWRTPTGFTLATRAGSNPAPVLSGSEHDLDSLIVRAAEEIYRQTQPYRYIAYLDRQGRIVEELAAARALALGGPSEEQPWAYTRWGVTLENLGDLWGALEKQRMATIMGPDLPHTWYNLASAEAAVGHSEAAFQDNLKALNLLQSPAANQLAPFAVAADVPILKMLIAEARGDYRDAVGHAAEVEAIANYGDSHQSAPIMASADLAIDHDEKASRNLDRGTPDAEAVAMGLGANGSFEMQPLPTLQRAVAIGDWKTARDDLIAQDNSAAAHTAAVKPLLPVLTWPWLALAYAKLGEFASAQALIGKTPLDCDLCLRLRGDIEAQSGNGGGASYWFARAIAAAPSLPFAYADWGAMLLHKGDYDGAIAKFRAANQQGPHFADPLEMWGEALIEKNRSDLALGKFEEANQYAPNWGRLHLEWGKALQWSGDKEGARQQFEAAARMDLGAADRRALILMRPMGGK